MPKERIPITQELKRQQLKGFLEEKKGLVNPRLFFEIKLEDSITSLPVLTIIAKRLVYREQADEHISKWDGAKELLKKPDSLYEPFHGLTRSLVKIIGEGGETYIGIHKLSHDANDDEIWYWSQVKAENLEEGLLKYRFGEFTYNSPRNSSFQFFPHRDPNENYGDAHLSFKSADINSLMAHPIKDIEKFLYEQIMKQEPMVSVQEV